MRDDDGGDDRTHDDEDRAFLDSIADFLDAARALTAHCLGTLGLAAPFHITQTSGDFALAVEIVAPDAGVRIRASTFPPSALATHASAIVISGDGAVVRLDLDRDGSPRPKLTLIRGGRET